MNVLPGQFVFAWIPGVGEKPFSIMDDEPLTLGVLERGEFTKKFNSLKIGDEFYVRGPYGNGVDVAFGSRVVLVGGGCGLAGVYLLAKKLSKKAHVISLLGAKDKLHLPYIDEIKKYSEVRIATEDGSLGIKGLVTQLFDSSIEKGSYFFNCGPKKMIEAILPLELKYSSGEKIFSSIDYVTKCGVGICGSCSNEKGRRTCVEGVFMNNNL
jgi:dihydroorotate dehydrogenase (NAD+) catalytic subunit